jgi:hypothetical protein
MNAVIDLKNVSPAEFRKLVYATIAEKYGIAGLLRLFEEVIPKQGNYTEERKKWVNDLTIDDIFAVIERQRDLDKS